MACGARLGLGARKPLVYPEASLLLLVRFLALPSVSLRRSQFFTLFFVRLLPEPAFCHVHLASAGPHADPRG
jgi:hypothetical protein